MVNSLILLTKTTSTFFSQVPPKYTRREDVGCDSQTTTIGQ